MHEDHEDERQDNDQTGRAEKTESHESTNEGDETERARLLRFVALIDAHVLVVVVADLSDAGGHLGGGFDGWSHGVSFKLG
jgi:hypothetical protein